MTSAAETYFRNIVRTYHPYVKKHLPGQNIHYAAAWGNGYEESGGFRNLFERPGQSTGGVGGWQWTGMHPPNNRRALFEAFCREQGKKVTDIAVNVQYFVVETLKLEKEAWRHVLMTSALYEATETFMLKWERPATQGGRPTYGTARLDIRYKGAQIALSEIEALEKGKPDMSDEKQVPAATTTEDMVHLLEQLVQHAQHLPVIANMLTQIEKHIADALHLPGLPSLPASGKTGGVASGIPWLQLIEGGIKLVKDAKGEQ